MTVETYKVGITAINELGSLYAELERPFYVQIPLTGLTMKAVETYIHFGQIASFTAELAGGTNVTLSWKLDDETELIDAGQYFKRRWITFFSTVNDYNYFDDLSQINNCCIHA